MRRRLTDYGRAAQVTKLRDLTAIKRQDVGRLDVLMSDSFSVQLRYTLLSALPEDDIGPQVGRLTERCIGEFPG